MGERSRIGPGIGAPLARFTRHARPGGGADDAPSPSMGLFVFADLSASFDL